MLFNSVEYAVFLPIVAGIYYCLEKRLQNLFLIAASLFFYGWWDWRFCALLVFSIALDYTCALRLVGAGSRAKYYLWLSLGGNLGVLGLFKYFYFFAASFAELLRTLGLNPSLAVLGVILPVGISFYTFQTLAYTIDVYRGDIQPCRDPVVVALYVCFFSQLVAGPIERPRNLIPQFEEPRRIDQAKLASGMFLIFLGLFRKLAIADAVAPRVDEIFQVSGEAPWTVLVEGAWLFAIQIYCDFSGYSDIARGTARLFGIELMKNFNQPYLATNITQFWRRWHISLSSWLRDYVYIPLGGNRGGNRNTYCNLLLTMVLGGLWHGANWTFVVWGLLHGVYLAVHKWLKGRRAEAESAAHRAAWPGERVLSTLFTFLLVLLTWVLFRSPTLGSAVNYLAGILLFRGGWDALSIGSPDGLSLLRRVAVAGFYGLLVLAVDIPQHRTGQHNALETWYWPARGAAYFAMLLSIILLQPDNETPFIYFQF